MKNSKTEKNNLPLWDLTPIYAGFTQTEYLKDKERLKNLCGELLSLVDDSTKAWDAPVSWLESCISGLNTVLDLFENLYAYAYTRFSVNTQDPDAQREINLLDEAGLPLKDAQVRFRNQLARISEKIPSALSESALLSKYGFFLKEELFFQSRQMTQEEENLAADLSRTGGEAWGRLQEAVSSTLTAVWDDTSGEKKTVTELRALAYDRDRPTRQKAYRLELEAWKKMEIPLSFAINGVKGFSYILNGRRNFKSTLERSVNQARITDKTLHCMIGAMEESLPKFRLYLKGKAKALGIPSCSFYDIFAPVGKSSKTWSFTEARELILEQFTRFSPDLADLADRAFRENWIDSRPRQGKVGGAYCIDFPLLKVSRILCNFGGTFGDVATVAHELGHAYHHHVLKDAGYIHRAYPMTLAETASIFNESIILQCALKTASPEEGLTILELFLQETTQVIVDILSRFYFERGLMEQRERGELPPEELCGRMIDAQKKTYGEGLNQEELHPYMWAVKSHYYRQDLAFYNFPYAFGQLFGLGLYSLYQDQGTSFAPRYREILGQTGKASAEEIAKSAGFDLESREFWRAGLELIENKISDFLARV